MRNTPNKQTSNKQTQSKNTPNTNIQEPEILTVNNPQPNDTIEKIETGLKEAKIIINQIDDKLEENAIENPALKKSWFYKKIRKLNSHLEALPTEVSSLAIRALEDYLNLMLLKKGIKSLISFTFFALALFFFAFKSASWFFLVLSSLCMLFSYGFFILSVIKNVPRWWHFAKGYLNDGLEGGVVAFLFSASKADPGLKEQLVRSGVQRVKNDRALTKVLLKSFGKTLISFLLKLGLIVLAVFTLKKLVIHTTGLTSSLQILFAPLIELYHLFTHFLSR